MRTRKVFAIILLALIAQIVISCCDCDVLPYTNYSEYRYYTHSDLMLSSVDNSGPSPVAVYNDSVDKCAFGMHVIIDRIEVKHIEQIAHKHPTGLIQSAWAYDCFCPQAFYFMPKDSMLTLEVISHNAFDSLHSAYSDISEYFKIGNAYGYMNIDDYIMYNSWDIYEPEDLTLDFNIMLLKETEYPGEHKFTVRVIINDGRILEDSTNTISLI